MNPNQLICTATVDYNLQGNIVINKSDYSYLCSDDPNSKLLPISIDTKTVSTNATSHISFGNEISFDLVSKQQGVANYNDIINKIPSNLSATVSPSVTQPFDPFTITVMKEIVPNLYDKYFIYIHPRAISGYQNGFVKITYTPNFSTEEQLPPNNNNNNNNTVTNQQYYNWWIWLLIVILIIIIILILFYLFIKY